MNSLMDTESRDILIHFYNKLETNTIKNHSRLEADSLLLTLIKLPPNKVSKIISDSSINKTIFLGRNFDELVEKGLIKKADELGRSQEYIITAFGIWEIETVQKEFDIIKLLKYFQNTKLSFEISRKPLKNIEKTILFSLISIRNFSIHTAMDLNDQGIRDYWIDIFDSCHNFLYSIDIVNNVKWKTDRAGNEHPISYVMRRANDLPQKSQHIYQKTGSNVYYLDIDRPEVIPGENLQFLFELIIGDVGSIELINNIYTYLCDIAYDKGKNVRNNLDNINPEWDSILKDALDEFIFKM